MGKTKNLDVLSNVSENSVRATDNICTVALEFTSEFYNSTDSRPGIFCREDSYNGYKVEYVNLVDDGTTDDIENYFQRTYNGEVVGEYFENFLYLENGFYLSREDGPCRHNTLICHLEYGVISRIEDEMFIDYISPNTRIIREEEYYKGLEEMVPMYKRLYNEYTAKLKN